jgi:hypothetical protein
VELPFASRVPETSRDDMELRDTKMRDTKMRHSELRNFLHNTRARRACRRKLGISATACFAMSENDVKALDVSDSRRLLEGWTLSAIKSIWGDRVDAQ